MKPLLTLGRPGVLHAVLPAGSFLTPGVLLSCPAYRTAGALAVQEMSGHPAEQPCPAVALVPPGLQSAVLRSHPTVDLRLLAVYLTCALDAHDQGDHHAVLYDHFQSPGAGALWTRWPDGQLPSAFALHPDCAVHSRQGAACAHFLNHPGPHSWEPCFPAVP